MGDILAVQELQVGWHLLDDQANMAFFANLDPQYTLAAGQFHPYARVVDSLDAAIAFANELKRAYNVHLSQAGVHAANDSTNTVTSADATNLATANTLVTEIKDDFNLHIAGGGSGGAHTHSVPAHGHVLHLAEADVVDGATTRVNAATNLIGANSGADIEIAGVADDTGGGGIIDAAAAVSGSSGGGGGGAYHSPLADSVNTITVADATTLATLLALTAACVLHYRNHTFISALRMTERTDWISGDLPYDNTGEY